MPSSPHPCPGCGLADDGTLSRAGPLLCPVCQLPIGVTLVASGRYATAYSSGTVATADHTSKSTKITDKH